MAVFRFFKIAAVRHLGTFYVYLDHPRRVFVGLCHYAKFGWNRSSNFDNMPVLMFCEFGLKMPIDIPFGWFLRDLTPQMRHNISHSPNESTSHSGSRDVLIICSCS